MVPKMSSQARCWIAFLTAALLAFYIGYTPLHLFFEEHSHAAIESDSDSHHHHEHDHEHQPDSGHQSHSSDDHTLNFVAKSKVSFLAFDYVICEIASDFVAPSSLPVAFVEPFKIPDKSPPNRFSPRGPPAV